MAYEKRTDNITMGRWYYDNFYPLSRGADKRPLLFPFLVSLIHTFFGYRAENAFILNFLVLFSLLLLIYIAMKNVFGEIWGIASIIFVVSQPIIVQCATSGGFELLSTLFLVVCFCCLKGFLEKPDSSLRFQLLWASLLMLASIRYEGIISFFLVIIILTVLKYVKVSFFKEDINLIYFFTPLVLLSNYLAGILIQNPYEVTAGQPAFSVKYLIKNSIDIYKSLIDFRFYIPYATVINLIGAIALLYFINKFLEGAFLEKRNRNHLIAISAVCILVNFFSHLFYHQGWISHPSDTRFFIAYAMTLSILALIFMYSIDFFKKRPVYILLFSIMMFILYQPVSVEDRFSRTQTLPREYRFVMYYLEQEGRKNNNSFVVVADRPGMYTVHNYGAVDFNYANNNSDDLLGGFNTHLYRDIFAVQKIEYKTLKPAKDNELDRKYVLKTLAESQIDGDVFVRISRVLPMRQVFKPAEPTTSPAAQKVTPQQVPNYSS